jgi:hypothetical protein
VAKRVYEIDGRDFSTLREFIQRHGPGGEEEEDRVELVQE